MYENIFFDLADRELLVLMLGEGGGVGSSGVKNTSSSSSFAFKGKCLMGLLWGQVDLMGYTIRSHTTSPTTITATNNNNNNNSMQSPPVREPIRFYEVYSPESNSFLSIRNASSLPRKRKADTIADTIAASTSHTSDTTAITTRDYKQILIERLRFQLNSSAVLDECVETKFVEFLHANNFNPKTSSLIAIAPLKSQMCSYMSYFPNFQMLYNSSKLLTTTTTTTSTANTNLGQQHTHQAGDSEACYTRLAKFGLYRLVNSSLVFNQTDELANVVDEIVNNHGGGGSLLDSSGISETPHSSLANKTTSQQQQPVIMACGGKDVGKSTLLRFLINSLLNKYAKVGYIDCDPGQTEFTLSGCLSLTFISEPLLGPPHTHLGHHDSNASKSCYFLGHLSPNDVPSLYLDGLRQCHADFMEAVSSQSSGGSGAGRIPLVINTMGWNQGLGLCLLKESILMFKPTHVVQINHAVEANKNMPVLDASWLSSANGWPPNKQQKPQPPRSPPPPASTDTSTSDSEAMSVSMTEQQEPGYKLYAIKSAVPKPLSTDETRQQQQRKKFSPRDHRNLAIIAYFSRLQDPTTANPFVPIHHLKPYRIGWSKIGLHVGHMRVDLSQIFNVFNASLVGLCRCDPNLIKPWKQNSEMLYMVDVNDQSFNGAALKCFGFGIIRGINMETREFYVLTPEPIDVLNQVNVLAKGMLNLPLEFFYEQDYQTSCPYMTFVTKSSTPVQPAQRKYLVHHHHHNQGAARK